MSISDEEDEIQEEERHRESRFSHVPQHRRKELPVYEDSFAKRLGHRSKSALRERGSTASLTTDAPRRTLSEEISRSCKH